MIPIFYKKETRSELFYFQSVTVIKITKLIWNARDLGESEEDGYAYLAKCCIFQKQLHDDLPRADLDLLYAFVLQSLSFWEINNLIYSDYIWPVNAFELLC